jgi:soluble lytic murein transglycosylase-like protein
VLRKLLTSQGLAIACALVLAASPALAGPLEAVDGPCRVKLRTGRTMDATALQPADEQGAFWRVDLPGGGQVILPVRELRGVELLRSEPEAPEVATVPLPPEQVIAADADPNGSCDPLASGRLARWNGMAATAARKHGVDPALVRAIIAVESCGNPDAVSPKGALGLMQLMPKTALDYGCSDPKDPGSNLDAGCRHLARLTDKLGGNVDLVVAAYNAGEGAVAKAGGIPKYRETRNYVRDVKRHLARLTTAPSM